MQKKIRGMKLLIIGLVFFVAMFTFSAYGIRAGVKIQKADSPKIKTQENYEVKKSGLINANFNDVQPMQKVLSF